MATALGVWIRPEANLIIVVGWGWWFWVRRTALSASKMLPLMIAMLACLALPLLWRYTTFGDLLPTTYYAKSDRTIRSGIGFLFGAIHGYGPIVWCVSLIGLWGLRRTMGWAAASVVALGAYVVWVGGDVLIQRFSLWWLPFVALGLAAALKESSWSRALGTSGVIALLTVLLAGQELHRMYSVTRFMSENDGYVYVSANAVHTLEADAAIGRYLREHGSPADTVVTDNIGAIGYYSRISILDVNGLVDREIAELIHRDTKAQLPALIEKRHPRWIICYPGSETTRESFNLPNVGELPHSIVASYDRIGTWKSRTGYTRVLLRRRDG